MRSFKKWLESFSPIHKRLMQLRPMMAKAAQAVYDNWDQSDEHDEYNGGGICQDIAEAISDVVNHNFAGSFDVGTVSAMCGEQHVWCVMKVGEEGFNIDVPYSTYETGGGYSWKKIQGVKFLPDDIAIDPIPGSEAGEILDNPYG